MILYDYDTWPDWITVMTPFGNYYVERINIGTHENPHYEWWFRWFRTMSKSDFMKINKNQKTYGSRELNDALDCIKKCIGDKMLKLSSEVYDD